MKHEKSHYRSLEEVKAKASELGVSLPFADNTHILSQPLLLQPGRRRFRRHMV